MFLSMVKLNAELIDDSESLSDVRINQRGKTLTKCFVGNSQDFLPLCVTLSINKEQDKSNFRLSPPPLNFQEVCPLSNKINVPVCLKLHLDKNKKRLTQPLPQPVLPFTEELTVRNINRDAEHKQARTNNDPMNTSLEEEKLESYPNTQEFVPSSDISFNHDLKYKNRMAAIKTELKKVLPKAKIPEDTRKYTPVENLGGEIGKIHDNIEEFRKKRRNSFLAEAKKYIVEHDLETQSKMRKKSAT